MPISTFSDLSISQVEMILVHELAHIKRYDVLVNYFQIFIEILFFYHPVVWWISRQVRIERENCCDDLAAAFNGSETEYARALVKLEELRNSNPSMSIAAGGTSIFNRIKRLAGNPGNNKVKGEFVMTAIFTILLSSVMLISIFGGISTENAYARTGLDNTTTFQPERNDLKGVWEIDESHSSGYTSLSFKFNSAGVWLSA